MIDLPIDVQEKLVHTLTMIHWYSTTRVQNLTEEKQEILLKERLNQAATLLRIVKQIEREE